MLPKNGFIIALILGFAGSTRGEDGQKAQSSTANSQGERVYHELGIGWKQDVSRFMDQGIKFKGEVENVLGENAVVIDLDGFWGFDEVLVVSTTTDFASYQEGDTIKVRGVVRDMVTTDWNKAFGAIVTGGDIMNYHQKAYVVAESIEKAE